MKNPFQYGKEVSGYQFYDRTETMEELYCLLRDGSTNVVLSAPRRYGKTSLVLKVLERLRLEKTRCLHFDLSRVASLEKFCEAYAAAVYSLFGGISEVANRMTEYLTHLHPTFTFSTRGVSVRFNYGERMTDVSVSEVLELPEKLATDAGERAVVVAFDEFQEVAALSSQIPLEAVFRSVIQSHQRTRYVFLGSKTHLMKRMFGSATRPFYKSALAMKIGKPPKDESLEFLMTRFSAEGIALDRELGEQILGVSENIPYFLQAVAGLAFLSVERRRGTAVEQGDIDFALRRLESAGSDLYDEILTNLSPAQRILAEALADEPTGRFDEIYLVRHALGNPSTVHSACRELVNRGLVEEEAGVYVLSDPFMARHIRNSPAAKVLI